MARRAGLGWIGKNRFFFHREHGGSVGIAELVVDSAIQDGDAPISSAPCGECSLCFESCPTGALRDDGIAAPTCLSYLTAEFRGSIPEGLRATVGTRLFGCDTCLAACPRGQFSKDPAGGEDDLSFLHRTLSVRSNREFNRRFAGTPFFRLGRKAFLRNVAVVLGNIGSGDGLAPLEQALTTDPAWLVREHAAWGVGQIGGQKAKVILEKALSREEDATVRSAMERALAE
jgi:epoxyqueuosine reductase